MKAQFHLLLIHYFAFCLGFVLVQFVLCDLPFVNCKPQLTGKPFFYFLSPGFQKVVAMNHAEMPLWKIAVGVKVFLKRETFVSFEIA